VFGLPPLKHGDEGGACEPAEHQFVPYDFRLMWRKQVWRKLCCRDGSACICMGSMYVCDMKHDSG